MTKLGIDGIPNTVDPVPSSYLPHRSGLESKSKTIYVNNPSA